MFFVADGMHINSPACNYLALSRIYIISGSTKGHFPTYSYANLPSSDHASC